MKTEIRQMDVLAQLLSRGTLTACKQEFAFEKLIYAVIGSAGNPAA
jgi:hypothetical protein